MFSRSSSEGGEQPLAQFIPYVHTINRSVNRTYHEKINWTFIHNEIIKTVEFISVEHAKIYRNRVELFNYNKKLLLRTKK